MSRALIVWRKELLDAARDSRTVFLTLVLPLLLYPAIFSILARVEASNDAREAEALLAVSIPNLDQAPGLATVFPDLPQLHVVQVAVTDADLERGVVYAIVEIPDGHERALRTGRSSVVRIRVDETQVLARRALELVRAALESYRWQLVRSSLVELGGPAAVVDAQEIEVENVAPSGRAAADLLGTLVPYLLVILIASGASHTAIDATAGEKERSTLETILVSGASRRDLILGKFLATMTTSTLSGVMGFAGLLLTALSPTSFWNEIAADGVPLRSIAILLAMILPVAAFVSSLFLALGCFARGAREGQTFASYVIVFVIMLAIVSMALEGEPSLELYMVPIMGTMMVQRQLLAGTAELMPVLIALGSTVLVAGAVLAIAVRLFADERVMFRP